jgi:hypothetical protein
VLYGLLASFLVAAEGTAPFRCGELVEAAGRALSTEEIIGGLRRRGIAASDLGCVQTSALPASIRTAAADNVVGTLPGRDTSASGTRARLADGRWVKLFQDGSWTFERIELEASPAPTVRTDGFRGAAWGSTSSQIRRREHAALERVARNALVYTTSVGGLDTEATFFFIDSKLVIGRYNFTTEHIDDLDYIEDYEHVMGLMADRYGPPVVDRTLWTADVYRDRPEAWGFAVVLGHLSRAAEWDTQDSRVTLRLFGDGEHITLRLDYQSKAYMAQRSAAQKVKDSKGL